MPRLRLRRRPGPSVINDLTVKALTFAVPVLAVIAASSGDLTDPKLIALALGAGCGALLSLLHPPGRTRPPTGTA